MRYLVIIFSLVAGLSLALGHGTAHAAKLQPVVIPPTQITYTRAQTLPYEFEPLDINNPDVTPLPEVDLVSVSFINTLGSVALTLFAIFDQFQVLAIFLVLMLAVTILFYLWRYVTNRPSTVELKVSEGLGVAGRVVDAHTASLQEGVNYYQENQLALGPGADRQYQLDQGRIESNRQLSAGLRQGSRIFRRAKRDFSGNPFK